jgi:hypothetical protein
MGLRANPEKGELLVIAKNVDEARSRLVSAHADVLLDAEPMSGGASSRLALFRYHNAG